MRYIFIVSKKKTLKSTCPMIIANCRYCYSNIKIKALKVLRAELTYQTQCESLEIKQKWVVGNKI